MATGLSLHLGLNTIDPNNYNGQYQPLRNAENDARFYADLAKQKGFNSTLFIGNEATSNNLIDYLKDYAGKLNAGDTCFISYSGHGSRVDDLNKDEDDGFDEVLVLYDRLFIDDEFQLLWAKFRPGVRIFFINDSCYNGTVSKFLNLNKKAIEVLFPEHVLRGVDYNQTKIDFEKNLSFYKSIKLAGISEKAPCSIIHIGSCQDNQLSDDGSITDKNGKFTGAVRALLQENNEGFSYRSFFDKVKAQMPPWQTPNWDTGAGVVDEAFEKSFILLI